MKNCREHSNKEEEEEEKRREIDVGRRRTG